jgi:hypothetical protein
MKNPMDIPVVPRKSLPKARQAEEKWSHIGVKTWSKPSLMNSAHILEDSKNEKRARCSETQYNVISAMILQHIESMNANKKRISNQSIL